MRKGKKKYPVTMTVAEFKARLCTQLAVDRGLVGGIEPELQVRNRPDPCLVRPKGSAPTPSEVLGGRKLPKRLMPAGQAVPKQVREWLNGLGITV